MAQAGSLWVRLGLRSKEFNQGLDRAQARTKKFSTGLKQLAPAIGAAFAVGAVVSFGKQIFNLNAEFGSMISRVQALTNTSDELTAVLSKQAQVLGKKTQFTATQAAEAMTFLAQAGLSVNEIYKAMPNTLELAAAGQLELAEAADISTNIMSAYGLQAEDLNRVNDIIANTASNANTNVREFAEAFKMVGPIAKSADQSIKDVSASIGLLANSGIKGTMAGTALRTMMSKLIAPTGDAAKILKKFAIETIDQSTGNLRKLNDILIDMRKAGLSTADMFEIFDLRAAGAAIVLKNASGTFDEFAEVVGTVGTAARIADKQMDNLKGDTLKMKSAWQGLMLSMGQGVDSELRGVVQGIAKIIPWLGLITDVFVTFKDVAVLSLKAIVVPLKNLTAAWADLFQLDFKGFGRNIKEIFTETADVFVDFGGSVSKRFIDRAKEIFGSEEDLFIPDDDKKKIIIEDAEILGANVGKAYVQSVSSFINNLEVDPLSATVEGVFTDNLLNEQLSDEIDLKNQLAEIDASRLANTIDWGELVKETQTEVIGGYVTMAEIIGRVANGIANAKGNWAAMAATVVSGIAQMIPQIKSVILATKALFVAKQAEAVAGAAASSQSIPFPGNLVALAASVGAVLASIAPFVGSFETGTDFVPFTGMAQLHKGEAVIPAAENKGGKSLHITGKLVAEGEDLVYVFNEVNRKIDNTQ